MFFILSRNKAVSPLIAMVLSLFLSPLIILIVLLGTPSNFDKNKITSEFAFPSIGGELSLIFKTPSKIPTIKLLEEFGNTDILNEIPSFSSFILIMLKLYQNKQTFKDLYDGKSA